jgi:hypothetical protein
MKKIIEQFLSDNLQQEYRYVGGGDEPSILVLKGSDKKDLTHAKLIAKKATELEKLINKYYE